MDEKLTCWCGRSAAAVVSRKNRPTAYCRGHLPDALTGARLAGDVVGSDGVTYMVGSREHSYAGLSLLWIRDVLDVAGPVFPSARAMALFYRSRLKPTPRVGQVVLWSMEPHGDIGLYVGDGTVLRMSAQGPYTAALGNDQHGYEGAMWWPRQRDLEDQEGAV